MYFVRKTFEFSAAHRLDLDYESRCTQLHGHNWVVTVECASEQLDRNGMVVDFTHIKRRVIDVLDFNPTAENIARWIVETVPHCRRAEVRESEGNTAAYEV